MPRDRAVAAAATGTAEPGTEQGAGVCFLWTRPRGLVARWSGRVGAGGGQKEQTAVAPVSQTHPAPVNVRTNKTTSTRPSAERSRPRRRGRQRRAPPTPSSSTRPSTEHPQPHCRGHQTRTRETALPHPVAATAAGTPAWARHTRRQQPVRTSVALVV